MTYSKHDNEPFVDQTPEELAADIRKMTNNFCNIHAKIIKNGGADKSDLEGILAAKEQLDIAHNIMKSKLETIRMLRRNGVKRIDAKWA